MGRGIVSHGNGRSDDEAVMQKNRRKSREIALQALYACEIGETSDCSSVIENIVDEDATDDAVAQYAKSLVVSVVSRRAEIDALLQRHTANWDVKRMTAIDRNILRMAVVELERSEDVPFKVVIDEAVELAKQYGTDDSGKFVNGVIDSIRKEMPEKKQP
jgi:transcription antitermination protein NusB